MPTIRVERPNEHMRLPTLDRPERLNAMNHELVAEPTQAIQEAIRAFLEKREPHFENA